MRLEVGLDGLVLVGALGGQELERAAVALLVVRDRLGPALHVLLLGRLGEPLLRHVAAHAPGELREDLAHVLGLPEGGANGPATADVGAQVVGPARVQLPALEVRAPRQDHVRVVRRLVVEGVDADVEPDLLLVEEDVAGHPGLRPGQRRVEVVGHVDLHLRALLQEEPVDDLPHLHLVPGVRQGELGRVGEQGGGRGLPRLGRQRHALLVDPAGVHPAPAARLPDAADEAVQQDDAAVVQ